MASTWTSIHDKYGRRVWQLRAYTARAGFIVGVVVKHPLKKVGEPGAYWYCDWRDHEVVNFATAKAAKAGLEAKVA